MFKKGNEKDEKKRRKLDGLSIKDIAAETEEEAMDSKNKGEKITGKSFRQHKECDDFMDEDTKNKAIEVIDMMKKNNNGFLYLSTEDYKDYGSQTIGMMIGHNQNKIEVAATFIAGSNLTKGEVLAAYELAQERKDKLNEEDTD